MTFAPLPRAGDSVSSITTPALILDLAAFRRNVRSMQRLANEFAVQLRPHAKAHRSSQIAKAQIAAGASGICCQTTGEAERFASAGIADVHIANIVADEAKIRRIAELARMIRIAACVDDLRPIEMFEHAAAKADSKIELLIEIDVGDHRCGVASVGEAVALAHSVNQKSHLKFGGIQAYLGRSQHIRDPAERRRAASDAAEIAKTICGGLAEAGLSCPRITGGGTGSAPSDVKSGVLTELQPGSYVFLDGDYSQNEPGVDDPALRQSLFILTQVVSVARPGRVVCDAGLKSYSTEFGLPTVHEHPHLQPVRVSDEHLAIECHRQKPSLGERLLLVPAHCDPTVNLHDCIICIEGGIVADVWPVDARGASA